MQLAEVVPYFGAFEKEANGSRSANAYIGFLAKKSDKIFYKMVGPGPCHGAIQKGNYVFNDFNPTDFAILSKIQNLRVEKPVAEGYFDYLVNRSPFKEAFLNKDTKNGNVWAVRTDLPANLVGAALMASRTPTENYLDYIHKRLAVFEEIKSLGFSENFAYIFSFVYQKTDGKKYQFSYAPLACGHCVFSFNKRGEDYFRNFINNTPPNLSKETFYENMGYSPNTINNIWGGFPGDAFMNWLQCVKPIKEVGKKDLNIFAKTKSVTYYYESKEDFKNVLQQVERRIFDV